MLSSANLNTYFWGEAVLCATNISNRTPTCYNSTYAAHLWYGRVSNYWKFKAFGCDAYLLTPKVKHTNKMSRLSRKLTFVGYN